MVDDLFYYKFEQRFRGSREEIKGRLLAYIPLLQLIERSISRPKSIDFGCGRCEWLELLLERGWDALGVDANRSMLEAGEVPPERIVLGDAGAYISDLAADSLDLITGFHIAEHLPLDVLIEFLTQCRRVLKPSGILLLETPNPENLQVGSNRFYMDPTHVRPISPDFLFFLANLKEFQLVETIGINGPSRIADDGTIASALKLYRNIAPDYSLVAVKSRNNGVASEMVGLLADYRAQTFLHADEAFGVLESRIARLETTLALSQMRWFKKMRRQLRSWIRGWSAPRS